MEPLPITATNLAVAKTDDNDGHERSIPGIHRSTIGFIVGGIVGGIAAVVSVGFAISRYKGRRKNAPGVPTVTTFSPSTGNVDENIWTDVSFTALTTSDIGRAQEGIEF